MSNAENQINDDIDWLKNSDNINYYEYFDFNDIQEIGRGSFGCVFRATWKNTNFYALKSFDKNDIQTLKGIVKEV